MTTISPTQSNIQAALASFIAEVTGLVPGTTIISGQGNRAPEPQQTSFVVITPIAFRRMATNVDIGLDCKFTGSISGTTMTVSEVSTGMLAAPNTVFGLGVAAGTSIIEQISGSPGGVGTYEIEPSQTVGSKTMQAGTKTLTQNAIVTVQVDFHTADLTGGDLAQVFSTALRDEYGVDFFAGLAAPLNGVVPIEADDPKQVPFVNAENQYEFRWSVDCKLNVQQVIAVPQEFSDSVVPTLKDVSALYPIE